MQSLITAWRLHEIDVHTCLVDVLQRVGQHRASRVAELTRSRGSSTSQRTRAAQLCIPSPRRPDVAGLPFTARRRLIPMPARTSMNRARTSSA